VYLGIQYTADRYSVLTLVLNCFLQWFCPLGICVVLIKGLSNSFAVCSVARGEILLRPSIQSVHDDVAFILTRIRKMAPHVTYWLAPSVLLSTRSSATAERQRVSYARLSGLTHWWCTSLNTTSVAQLHCVSKRDPDIIDCNFGKD